MIRYVLVALLLFCALAPCTAFALDRAQAWANCSAYVATQQTNEPAYTWTCKRYVNGSGVAQNSYAAYRNNVFYYGYWSWTTECSNGGSWDESTHTCLPPCNQRAPVQNRMVRGSINTCYQGCEYAPDTEGFSVRMGSGNGTISGGTSWRPTGQTCGSQPPPEKFNPEQPTCVPLSNNMIECVKPNGTHCITGATGVSNCWSPFETGQKLTADGTFGGDRELSPTTPTPPTNQQNPQVTNTTNTTINNNTYNTSVSTGSGISGPGQVGSGVPGDANGDGKVGEGESAGDGDTDFGTVGAGVGTLYTKSTDTVSSLMTGFFAQLNATPIAQGITNFMMVQGGGTCPVFVLPASRWWDSMVLDMHCNGDFYNFLLACGWVIFAMASYVAVKMAMT